MPTLKYSWDSYAQKFRKKAEYEQVSELQISKLLDYAKNLHQQHLPIIFDKSHLALLLGYEEQYIDRVLHDSTSFYRHYRIPKKNGDYRQISEPLPSLKEIQNWLLHNVLYQINCSIYSKAYVTGTSIKTNAKFHKGQEVVLSLDIENYFPSLKIDRVKLFFESIGYSNIVATALSKLCCLRGALPQGAPTSPYLSNLLTIELDEQLGQLATQYNLRYTRYADDITISGTLNVGLIINKCRNIIIANELKLNEKKIRAKGRHEQQIVTGVIVNNTKLTAPRDRRKKLRQEVFYIKKYGLESHMHHCNINRANYLAHLLGIANYILHINPDDNEAAEYKQYIHKLMEDYN